MSAPAAKSRQPLGVAVAGFGWMGRVHTQAYARVLHHFPQLPLAPRLVAVADEVPGRAEEAAASSASPTATRDWRDLAADPAVQAVSIAAPNFLHREIGVAMAQAGKHIWIEKPVGLTTADAHAVADAVRPPACRAPSASTTATRRPSQAARELIAVRRARRHHARPVPAVQRLRGAPGGRAELAFRARTRRQRGARRPGLARRRPGPVPAGRHRRRWSPTPRPSSPNAPGRPAPPAGMPGPPAARWARWRTRTTSSSLLRFASGARGTLEASRVAVGEQNNYGFEIHGTKGAVFWDFRRMGELGISAGTAYQDQAVSTIFVGPATVTTRPSSLARRSAWATTTSRSSRPTTSCARSPRARPYGSTLDDAVRSAVALDAMAESAASGTWVSLAMTHSGRRDRRRHHGRRSREHPAPHACPGPR